MYLSLEYGIYPDKTLSFSRLTDVSNTRAKINVIHWNRQETLNKFLENNLNKCYTGQEILDIIYSIDRSNPMIFEDESD